MLWSFGKLLRHAGIHLELEEKPTADGADIFCSRPEALVLDRFERCGQLSDRVAQRGRGPLTLADPLDDLGNQAFVAYQECVDLEQGVRFARQKLLQTLPARIQVGLDADDGLSKGGFFRGDIGRSAVGHGFEFCQRRGHDDGADRDTGCAGDSLNESLLTCAHRQETAGREGHGRGKRAGKLCARSDQEHLVVGGERPPTSLQNSEHTDHFLVVDNRDAEKRAKACLSGNRKVPKPRMLRRIVEGDGLTAFAY